MKIFVSILIILFFYTLTSCKKFPDLGEGYKLTYNSRGDIGIVNSSNSYVIYGHILDYSFNANFIIAAERPRDSIPECVGVIPNTNLKKCDDAFAKSIFLQYWIIDKRYKSIFNEHTKTFSNVYGPFNKEEYLFKKKKLNIPDELKLK